MVVVVTHGRPTGTPMIYTIVNFHIAEGTREATHEEDKRIHQQTVLLGRRNSNASEETPNPYNEDERDDQNQQRCPNTTQHKLEVSDVVGTGDERSGSTDE